MVRAREAYRTVCDMLQKAGVPDAGFDADVLFTHAVGTPRFFAGELDDAQWADLLALARRRAGREPLQYIVGRWPFLDLELAVGPGVLIPRPETEEVCLAAARLLQQAGHKSPVILDLCSGTGALALGLQSLLPGAQVTAVELYETAFGYLEKNIASVAWEGNAPGAVRADAFTYYRMLEPASLDLIVANPPYVARAEYEQLAPEVHAEPRSALVAEGEGLAFYRAIARNYRPAVRQGGWLAFEIGAGQGAALRQILEGNSWRDVRIEKDMAGHDRIAVAQK